MPAATETTGARRYLDALPPLAIAVAAGLLVGVLTFYGQGLLPGALNSLANSSGSWSLLAFLLATLSARWWVSAVIGVVSLLAMVVGYDIGSLTGGYDSALGMMPMVFWLVVAVAVGPFLGVAGNAVRTRSRLAPAAVGVMSGVLAGEGAYGLTYIAGTTSPIYWTGSIVAAIGLLAWGIAYRFRHPRPALVAVAIATVVGAVFVAGYSSAPLLLLR